MTLMGLTGLTGLPFRIKGLQVADMGLPSGLYGTETGFGLSQPRAKLIGKPSRQ